MSTASVTVTRNVRVPMRDGTILRADVYRSGPKGKKPVLLIRTQYDKTRVRETYEVDRLARAGYIVVANDIRGRYASEGEYEWQQSFKSRDDLDGYDTVEWAARLPGSTGKVGTFGVSSDAWLQWKLAPTRPPSLKAMFAYSEPARYPDLEEPGTIRPGRRLFWYHNMAAEARRRLGKPGPRTRAEIEYYWFKVDREKWYWFLPWGELPEYITENFTDGFREWLKNPLSDPWRQDETHSEIDVPNCMVTGWYDHVNCCILNYTGMVKNGRTEVARVGQRLIIGHWNHITFGQRKVGDVDFGPRAQFDMRGAMIRWFDYWLKGVNNGVDRDPAVKIFVMGENRWRSENEWPVSRSRDLPLYLSSGGHANTPYGDGRLASKPAARGTEDRYSYDPRDPVMTMYGTGNFTVPTDQRFVSHRNDILVYRTEPLAEETVVTGYPKVFLHVSSSAPDTDFLARLIDVHPKGEARDLCYGLARARYRQSLEKPVFLKPGEIVELPIQLGPVSIRFKKGHSIRVDITSSDFPNFDRNHNTDKDNNFDVELRTADQTIYTGSAHPSRIILPQIL
jgi:uncharacterized protein